MLVGKEVEGEEGKQNGTGCSPEGEQHSGSFVLHFYLSLAGRNLTEVSGEGSVDYSSVLQGCGLH